MYASLEQLNTFGINPEAYPDSFDDTLKTSVLEMVSAEIDTYIAVAYALPLVAPYDLAIVKACCTIASYYLLVRRGFNPNNSNDQLLYENYKLTIDWLQNLARGRYLISNKSNSSKNLLNKPKVITS